MPYDLDKIKAQNDCRAVVESEIGPPRYRYAAYSQWRSPFGHGHSQNSFTAWGDHWKCWVTGEKGDVVAFLMHLRGLDFKQACEYLGGDKSLGMAYQRPPSPPAPKPAIDPNWIQDIHTRAVKRLWDARDRRGLDYLTGRGLWKETIEAGGLGFIPPELAKALGVKVGGIVIPAIEGGQVMACQIRALAGNFRYGSLGSTGGRLFGLDDIRPGLPVVAFEGAFDALIARQVGLEICTVATFGAANAIAPQFWPKLASAPIVLCFGDNDQAGRAWIDKHMSASPSFKGVWTCGGDHLKDLGDIYARSTKAANAVIRRYLDAWERYSNRFEVYANAMHYGEITNYPMDSGVEVPDSEVVYDG
jgi:hypothetical protein